MGGKMSILAGLFLLSACGQEPYHGKGWEVAFSPYVVAFDSEAKNHGRIIPGDYWSALTIQFGDPNEACNMKKLAGCCSRGVDGSRIVTISPRYWKVAESPEKYSIILHELGHCLLNQEHRGIIDPITGHATSIMYTTSPYGEYFQIHFQAYSEELFSH